MITFMTGNWGGKYPDEYVDKLVLMIGRNHTKEYRIVCLEESDFPCEPMSGTWAKLQCFNREIYTRTRDDNIHVWLDLDIVITGSLDGRFRIDEPQLHVIDDFGGGTLGGINSSVMWFRPRDVFWIWDEWVARGKPLIGRGDQDVTREITGERKTIVNDLAWSYKLGGWLPTKAICVFHGHPNPHEVPDDPIVRTYWK